MAEDKKNDRQPQIIITTSQEKEKARIEIEDNGPGMDDETKKEIFQPFYTTKPPGQGTGLGLSISYFIISFHHNGTIEVKSPLCQDRCRLN
jgi:signal transduction histidine kinase